MFSPGEINIICSDIVRSLHFERDWQPGKRSFIIRDPDGLVWEIIAHAR